MIRKIIKIDRDKCNGCGACASACHEGAIAMVDGKAHLMREDYCDGLGDCLPACPTNAISFEEREAPAYNEAAVLAAKAEKAAQAKSSFHGGCPGMRVRTIQHTAPAQQESPRTAESAESQLSQWPVQIQLAPIRAPYFDGAKLLIAADCTAYAFADFHNTFMRGKITLIGCPKLDHVDYSEKLTAILRENDIRSVTVIRMEVPCCGGIENAVKEALQTCQKMIPWQVVILSTDGKILE